MLEPRFLVMAPTVQQLQHVPSVEDDLRHGQAPRRLLKCPCRARIDLEDCYGGLQKLFGFAGSYEKCDRHHLRVHRSCDALDPSVDVPNTGHREFREGAVALGIYFSLGYCLMVSLQDLQRWAALHQESSQVQLTSCRLEGLE